MTRFLLQCTCNCCQCFFLTWRQNYILCCKQLKGLYVPVRYYCACGSAGRRPQPSPGFSPLPWFLWSAARGDYFILIRTKDLLHYTAKKQEVLYIASSWYILISHIYNTFKQFRKRDLIGCNCEGKNAPVLHKKYKILFLWRDCFTRISGSKYLYRIYGVHSVFILFPSAARTEWFFNRKGPKKYEYDCGSQGRKYVILHLLHSSVVLLFPMLICYDIYIYSIEGRLVDL